VTVKMYQHILLGHSASSKKENKKKNPMKPTKCRSWRHTKN